MAALVSALDTNNSIQYGENNHIEYKWSSVQQEKILQLSFQMVRTSDTTIKKGLAIKFRECFEKATSDEKKVLIKLLGHTRDIEEGKGEYALTFCIINELIDNNRELCVNFMKFLVGFEEMGTSLGTSLGTPLGSWKDMKYLFNELSSIPTELVNMINTQLKMDKKSMDNNENCSLVAKWIPREKSKKFGWINCTLAQNYFSSYGKNDWTKAASDKARTHYRKLVSSVNKYIDTTQVKQCGKMWKNINFDKVTSITMMKQKKAFLNSNSNTSTDRVICHNNLLQYMEYVKQGTKAMKGSNISMVDFVKQAIYSSSDEEKFIINEAWKNNSKGTSDLANIIAMVDTSGSMEQDNSNPLYSAIGLGCRVAEKSKLGKRILTFTANPEWINLEDTETFCEMVNAVIQIPWGMNTNFHKAMDMILDGLVAGKVPAEEVDNLILAVFSDMQFDQAERDSEYGNGTVREILEMKFQNAGIQVCGTPYKVPHILFWNLSSTDGFPELSYRDGYSMMSGFSPHLLNIFTERGIIGLRTVTPWNMLMKTLDKDRYIELEKLIV